MLLCRAETYTNYLLTASLKISDNQDDGTGARRNHVEAIRKNNYLKIVRLERSWRCGGCQGKEARRAGTALPTAGTVRTNREQM